MRGGQLFGSYAAAAGTAPFDKALNARMQLASGGISREPTLAEYVGSEPVATVPVGMVGDRLGLLVPSKIQLDLTYAGGALTGTADPRVNPEHSNWHLAQVVANCTR
jgi:hypothetical protein